MLFAPTPSLRHPAGQVRGTSEKMYLRYPFRDLQKNNKHPKAF